MSSGCSFFDDFATGTRADKEVAPSEKWNLKATKNPIGIVESINARKMFRVSLF